MLSWNAMLLRIPTLLGGGGAWQGSYYTSSKQMCQEGMKIKDVIFVFVFCEIVIMPQK
jgi:hypothetical protein